MTKLNRFEGQEVLATRITVTKTGDGLSEPLDMRPEEFHLGDEVFVLVRGEVTDVRHKPVKGTDGLARVHVVSANLGMVVDGSTGAALLEQVEADLAEKAEADERAAAEAAGVGSRVWEDDDDYYEEQE